MKYVYQLEIDGCDGLTGNGHKTVRTSTVFTSDFAARSRAGKAKRMAVERGPFGMPLFCPDFPVTVTIRKLEIVYDESWLKRFLTSVRNLLTYFSPSKCFRRIGR
jgi:hypothetical protein